MAGENDSNTPRVDAYYFENGEKNLRVQKYPDTCGQGGVRSGDAKAARKSKKKNNKFNKQNNNFARATNFFFHTRDGEIVLFLFLNSRWTRFLGGFVYI